jgi:hypothetical protein
VALVTGSARVSFSWAYPHAPPQSSGGHAPLPARHVDDVVQVAEGQGNRDDDTAPDGRLGHAAHGDLQPVNRDSASIRPSGASSALTSPGASGTASVAAAP